jgi:Tfp pilus assembly protein PilF
VCNNLGRHWSNRGKTTEGRAQLEHALAIREAALGPEHPRVADVLTNLGLNRMQADDLPAAAEYLRRSIVLLKKTLGEGSGALITPSRMLADVEVRQGDCPSAVARYHQVEGLLQASEAGAGAEAERVRVGLQRCAPSL